MNSSYIKLMLRGIKKSMARYISILAIVAIGVGFLGGLLATTPDMQLSVDAYYDEYNTFDINVKGSMGITEDDITALSQLSYVNQVEPRYSTDIVVENGEQTMVARLYGLVDFIKEGSTTVDQMELLEGRLPENANECLVFSKGSYGGSSESYALGTKFVFSKENKEYEKLSDTYAVDELTVVGIVENPNYMSFEGEPSTVGKGNVDLIMYADAECYNLEVYTDAVITVNGAKELNSFLEDYTQLVDTAVLDVEDLGKARSEIRIADVKAEANVELSEARETFQKEKADAERQLAEALETITDGKGEIADAKAEITSKKQELAEGEEKLAEAQKTLDSTIATEKTNLINNLDDLVNEQYLPLLAQINEAKAQGEAQISSGRDQIAGAKLEIENKTIELNGAKAQLEKAREEYNKGVEDLETNKSKYTQMEQQYNEAVIALENQISELRTQLENNKHNLTDEEYQAELEKINSIESAGKLQLAQTKEQLSSFKLQLEDAESTLNQTDIYLTEQENAISQGLVAIEESKIQIESQEANLNQQEELLYATISQKTQELNAAIPTIRQTILDEGNKQIESARVAAQAEIDANIVTINDGKKQITDADTQLVDAEKELLEGEEEYNEKKAEADKKLADAQKEIDDAQQKIDDIEAPKWYVLTREDNVSYVSYKSNAEKVGAIATVFPIFFFLVAALVALTTMTRMIEEERTQIGTLKALGYKKTTILGYYMSYSISASLIGSVIGIILGFYTLPVVIAQAYSMMYILPPTITAFYWDTAIIIIGISIACTALTTLSACLGQLKERPATLMLPRAPKAGKRILLERIGFIWKRLTFTQKVTARNIFRYKKRLFMTVFGIAGCCALLVTGFGVRDSIGDIVNKQFGPIYNFNLTLNLKTELGEDENIVSILEDTSLVSGYAGVHTESLTINKQSLTVYVPEENKSLEEMIILKNRKTGEKLDFGSDAVILTEKLCEQLSLKVGDTFTAKDLDGNEASFTLTGITENYLSAFMFIGADAFKAGFNKDVQYKTVLASLTSSETEFREGISEKLLESDDVAYVSFTDSIKESFENSVKNIDYIVMVLIICAGGLAIIVLYNLTNINISERKRELATTKVLGFHRKEVAAYIYRETTILCILGILVGFVLGIFLHGFVISTAEVDAVMFGREIYPMSYVFATIITLIFTALVDIIMLKKLDKIDMVESMKANE